METRVMVGRLGLWSTPLADRPLFPVDSKSDMTLASKGEKQ